ncbi:MAG TPA: hypothetical protein VI356_10495 [Myxococcales bacterium]
MASEPLAATRARLSRPGVARLLAVLAAAAALVALALPLWACAFHAPQYSGEPIRITLDARGLSGDFEELDHVDQYAGVHVPRTVPGLELLRPTLAAIAALLLGAAALKGAAGTVARRAAAALFACALGAVLAWGQWQLYRIGHTRDAHAVIAGFQDFTPLILGPTHVGNFHVVALPGAGGWLLAVAVALAFVSCCALRAPPVGGKAASSGAGCPHSTNRGAAHGS